MRRFAATLVDFPASSTNCFNFVSAPSGSSSTAGVPFGPLRRNTQPGCCWVSEPMSVYQSPRPGTEYFATSVVYLDLFLPFFTVVSLFVRCSMPERALKTGTPSKRIPRRQFQALLSSCIQPTSVDADAITESRAGPYSYEYPYGDTVEEE